LQRRGKGARDVVGTEEGTVGVEHTFSILKEPGKGIEWSMWQWSTWVVVDVAAVNVGS